MFRNNTRELMRNRGRRMRLTEGNYPNYLLDRFDSIDDLRDELRELSKTERYKSIMEFNDTIDDKYGKGARKIFSAYYFAPKGAKLVDLSSEISTIRLTEVEGVIDFLRDFGVEEFALSAIPTATEFSWEFIKNGCKLKGMEQIGGKPAFIFDIMN